MIDTLIISDIHMGYVTSRAKEVRQLLNVMDSQRTILLGDIFTDFNFANLNLDCWGLVEDLRKRAGTVWLFGNHDPQDVNLVPAMLGLPCASIYEWESFGRKCIAIHGHQYDTVVSNNPELAKVLTELFIKASEKGWVGSEEEHAFDMASLKWSREEPKVEAGVMALANRRGAEFAFCGHTHNPKTLTLDGVYYFNTGCWIGETMSYVTIEESGTRLRTFEGKDVV